mgnify:FL=1
MEDYEQILSDALNGKEISANEGEVIYNKAPLTQLIFIANQLKNRAKRGKENKVGWIIDRNINLSNICVTGCKFCNFSRSKNSPQAYITTIEEYEQKITELFALGGNQVLLQGGMNPDFDLNWYCELFKSLKKRFPKLVLHALGPAEVAYLSKNSGKSFYEVLKTLKESGLDSLPGAGAEILVDRVRKIISPAKCSAKDWLEVMHQAHILNLPTSATMVFGHVETILERMQHLVAVRETQNRKPDYSEGFITFIAWPFWSKGTRLEKQFGKFPETTSSEYIRMTAIARIMLNNIPNIQASWLTVGKSAGQICLHAGANDFGSIMIEEHVVSAAGANFSLNKNQMTQAIKEAGFQPFLRNNRYKEV